MLRVPWDWRILEWDCDLLPLTGRHHMNSSLLLCLCSVLSLSRSFVQEFAGTIYVYSNYAWFKWLL